MDLLAVADPISVFALINPSSCTDQPFNVHIPPCEGLIPTSYRALISIRLAVNPSSPQRTKPGCREETRADVSTIPQAKQWFT